jgi:hypothetical protein
LAPPPRDPCTWSAAGKALPPSGYRHHAIRTSSCKISTPDIITLCRRLLHRSECFSGIFVRLLSHGPSVWNDFVFHDPSRNSSYEEVPSNPSWSSTVVLPDHVGICRACHSAMLCFGPWLVIGAVQIRPCQSGVCLHMAGEIQGTPVSCQTFPICIVPMADLTVRLSIFDVDNRLALPSL